MEHLTMNCGCATDSVKDAETTVSEETLSKAQRELLLSNFAVDEADTLEKALLALSPYQRDLLMNLYSSGQDHLFQQFLSRTTSPALRRQFAQRLESLDRDYPDGGLMGYIRNAKRLLESSRQGVNPLEDWFPSVPQGESFQLGTIAYSETEALGRKELGSIGFVLVAGGLGERLGYNGIKLALPIELSSGSCYLRYYSEYILALQSKYAKGKDLPLCIMTSADTNDRTVKLLEENDYFGLKKDQVTIVQQGQGVPALIDNDARLAVDPDDPFKIVTKPHGHGDIHALLYKHGVARKWREQGLRWLILFQDTNGLAFHTLPLMLGVSTKMNLLMNSLAVPRKAKQAIGGIAKLTNKSTGETRTINVEYNQLDPLLRATGHPNGDVNDEGSGFSPYPGNINQLLFDLDCYASILERTRGIMPEFVNPKYTDDTKTVFKKPTRLECMMQDFPTVLQGSEVSRVGFTSISADLCFSPVKNATVDGVALQANGTHPGTAASGEADQYNSYRLMLRTIGCRIEQGPVETYKGINVTLGPAVVLKPSFVCCPAEYKTKFPYPERVRISSRSTLIVRGEGVVIESLDLDGACIIDCPQGEEVLIKDRVIRNEGWVFVRDEDSQDEKTKMRGYRLVRKDAERIPSESKPCIVL